MLDSKPPRDQLDAAALGSNRWSPRPLRTYPLDPALFERCRTVQTGDVDQTGALRLDATARYLSDLGIEHLDHAPDGERHPNWVVARTVIEVQKPIRFGERVTLFRWPAAASSRWFTARVQIRGDVGGMIEAEQFLICANARYDRVVRMSDEFITGLSATTGDRLRWQPTLRAQPCAPVRAKPFPVRSTDLAAPGLAGDGLAWHGVVEALSDHPDITGRAHRATVEHRGPVRAGDVVSLASWRSPSGLHQHLEVDGVVKSIAHVTTTGSDAPHHPVTTDHHRPVEV